MKRIAPKLIVFACLCLLVVIVSGCGGGGGGSASSVSITNVSVNPTSPATLSQAGGTVSVVGTITGVTDTSTITAEVQKQNANGTYATATSWPMTRVSQPDSIYSASYTYDKNWNAAGTDQKYVVKIKVTDKNHVVLATSAELPFLVPAYPVPPAPPKKAN